MRNCRQPTRYSLLSHNSTKHTLALLAQYQVLSISRDRRAGNGIAGEKKCHRVLAGSRFASDKFKGVRVADCRLPLKRRGSGKYPLAAFFNRVLWMYFLRLKERKRTSNHSIN